MSSFFLFVSASCVPGSLSSLRGMYARLQPGTRADCLLDGLARLHARQLGGTTVPIWPGCLLSFLRFRPVDREMGKWQMSACSRPAEPFLGKARSLQLVCPTAESRCVQSEGVSSQLVGFAEIRETVRSAESLFFQWFEADALNMNTLKTRIKNRGEETTWVIRMTSNWQSFIRITRNVEVIRRYSDVNPV